MRVLVIKNFDEYKKMYDKSISDPEGFWAEIANGFEWYKKWNKVRSYDFTNKIDIKFFEGGQTNISVNCLDRHVKAGKGKGSAHAEAVGRVPRSHAAWCEAGCPMPKIETK